MTALPSIDEAHFYINGNVNNQNFHYQAEHNPHELHKRLLHSTHGTFWGAVDFRVIGLYFFEEGDETVTVNCNWYIEMLENFLLFKLDGLENKHLWFQQDRARAHTACSSLEMLKEIFLGHLISLRGDMG